MILYQLNEQKLQLLGLTDDTGAVVNNAVVTATMRDAAGAVIPEINGVVLTSINTNGDYSYTIPSTFNPTASFSSICTFTASVGGVLKLTIKKTIPVEART